MIFQPYVWDAVLIALATYVAIVSLVRMMRTYRQQLVTEMRTVVLERRALNREKNKSKTMPKEQDKGLA